MYLRVGRGFYGQPSLNARLRVEVLQGGRRGQRNGGGGQEEEIPGSLLDE